MDFISRNADSIDDRDLVQFLERTIPASKLLKTIALRLLSASDSSISVYAGQILAENFSNDNDVLSEVEKIDRLPPSDGRIVALSIGWPELPVLKDRFEEVKGQPFPFNEFAAYHLKFLFRDVDNILEFIENVLENYAEAQFFHINFISPLVKRVKRDQDLQEKIKEKLFVAELPSAKVSLYSITDFVNPRDKEVLDWKKSQIDKQVNNVYGYNILTNEVTSLLEVLHTIQY